MSRADTVRFRHHQAILIAALIAFISALPIASAEWYLLPILLVPVAVAAWAWRAGTDADRQGVRVRALLGQEQIPWARIVELAGDPRGRARARLDDGRSIALPAVGVRDLPKLVSASGQSLSRPTG